MTLKNDGLLESNLLKIFKQNMRTYLVKSEDTFVLCLHARATYAVIQRNVFSK